MPVAFDLTAAFHHLKIIWVAADELLICPLPATGNPLAGFYYNGSRRRENTPNGVHRQEQIYF